MDAIDVKAQNLGTVMRLLCTGQAETRNQLAELTGLTRMTITNLTVDLLARGVIVEGAPATTETRPGRVARRLELAPHSPVLAGIWLARRGLLGIVTDLALGELVRREVALTDDDTAESVLDKAVQLGRELMTASGRRVAALGVAMSGVVNAESGAIERVIDFHGIDSLPLTSHLREHLDVPIVADNMMHASALAEYHYGVGQQNPDFIYVGLSEGVGASIITDGRAVGAGRASGGELGHMSIDYNGPSCSCGGRGCLELYASMPRLIAGINEATGAQHVTAETALAACLTDTRAAAVLDDVIVKLAVALNNLVNLLDVFTVVVGDDSVHIPDVYLTRLEEELNRMSLFRGVHPITVIKSRYGMDAPLVGSAVLVMDRVFAGDKSLLQGRR